MPNKISLTSFIIINIFAYFTYFASAQTDNNNNKDVLSESRDINPISYGILKTNEKTMPPDVWNNTYQEDVLPLLSILPNSNFQSIHILTYRLFISEAFPPITASDSIKDSIPYAKYRIEWLIENGHINDAIRLILFIPQKYRIKFFGRKLIDLYLATKNYPKSCSLAINPELWTNHDIPYRKQVDIFCLILKEKLAEAEFTLSIYKEQNLQEDHLFDTLINFLLFDIRPNNSLALNLDSLSPLHVSMLADTNLNAHIIDEDAPASSFLLEMLSHTNNLSFKQRLIMAQRLAIKQPETMSNLQNIFALFAINALNSNPNIEINSSPSVDNQAIIYSKIVFSKQQNEKAKLIKLSLELSNSNWFAMVKLHESQLLSIQPSSELSWFAPTAARAMFALGHIKDAIQWFNVIPHNDPNKRGSLALLALISENQLVNKENIIPPQMIIKKNLINSTNPQDILLSDTYLSIAQMIHKENNKISLELQKIRQSWIANTPEILIISLPTTEPISTIHSLFQNAINKQKIGYAILLSNIALSSQKKLSPKLFTDIIYGLQTLGLKQEAMDITRDYIIFQLTQ